MRIEKCCCCLHIHNAACAIGVIQLIGSLIWTLVSFSVLYMNEKYFNLPEYLNDFIRLEYGSTNGQHFLMWLFSISLFISSIFVLIGNTSHNGRWYWASLITNTLLIGYLVESHASMWLNEHKLSTYFWFNLTFILIDIYFTIMLYKGKSYLDWLQIELVQAKQMEDLIISINEHEGNHHLSRNNPTAPENEYYVLN